MRVSKEQAAKNRKNILDSAATLFRTRGIDGVGIDQLMAETGLTHGCLYSQFASREDLVAEACRHVLDASVGRWQQRVDDPKIRDARVAIIERYLSKSHFEDPGDGCLLSTLVTEIAKQPDSVRKVFTSGLKQLASILENATSDDRTNAHTNALSTLATMVGALVLARAVSDAKLSNELLQSAKLQLLSENQAIQTRRRRAAKRSP